MTNSGRVYLLSFISLTILKNVGGLFHLHLEILVYFGGMISRRVIFLSAVVLPVFLRVDAQTFGGNPAGIKWRQVNTNAAKIIYPKGMDSVADRVATVTSTLVDNYSSTIGNLNRKVSVVLQANNTLSNAYVGLAPYRSEFYLTTPQNPFELGSLNWADNLAIHEFRHVEQYSNFNKGLSKAFAILLGEQGQAFANALAVPDWFFEGDAVWNETAFSNQGRGRMPEFFNAYKSLYFDGRQYSYMKLRNGSYRDFVPNHYDIGYLLVAYGREKYGDSIWRKITEDAVRFKGVFYPMQKAVKRHTGQSYSTFVKDAFNYFQEQWKDEISKPTYSNVNWITATDRHNVVDYKYPYPAEDNSLIVLKKSYRKIPAFTRVKADGQEEKIAVKDIANDDYFSYKNGRIVYTTLKPDLRWGNRDFTVIRLLDVQEKTVKSIAAKSKYFSPDISADGQQIVAVEADPASACVLQLISVDGTILKTWTADPGLFYSHPKFLENDQQVIVAARKKDGQIGWLIWNTETGDSEWLLNPANQMIGFPVVVGDSLFYTGTVGETDGLYAIDLAKKSDPVLVANYRTGLYQGFARNGKIIGSSFTTDGYRLGNFEAKNFTPARRELVDLYVPGTFYNKPDVTAIATKDYSSKKYNKAFRLVNFHSWQPEISDPDYSISLLGENVLSTLFSEIYYMYNRNEGSNKLGISEIFGGWYVEPYANLSKTWGREVQLNTDTTLIYNQANAGVGLQLPLNLSANKAYRYLTLSTSFNHEDVRWSGFAKDRYKNFDFNYISARAVYSVQIQKARQQIYPRYAESFVADYKKSLGNNPAWQYLLSGYLYLPGIGNNHNLVLSAAYQRRDTFQNYIYSNSFPFSRGYQDVNFPKMLRLGANYHLPLLYPDWGFGNILYFQRIRLNMFYDHTIGTSIRTGKDQQFSTAGGEMYFDTKWWNQLPVTFGVRYSRLLDNEYRGTTNPNQWEFILPINLLPR